jgi:exoribonuclease-2
MYKKNDIVEYYDNRRITCGLVLDADDRRLRVLTDKGQEAKVPVTRVLIGGRHPGFAAQNDREQIAAALRELSAKRESEKERIDLKELWEIVSEELDETSLEDLSELLFGSDADQDNMASLMRAVTHDRLYFKARPERIEVHSPERVEQTQLQLDKERERERFLHEAAETISSVKEGRTPTPESMPDGLIPLMEEAAGMGRDWTNVKTVKDIFAKAGAMGVLDPFHVLVRLGHWSKDENVRLRTERVPVEFEPSVETAALDASLRPLPDDTKDLTHLPTYAVDAETTRDVDDALSVERHGDQVVLGIHITDAAHYVDHGSLLDLAVRQRATSIYLPETTIPMMPPVLSEKAASLTAGEVHPAVSIMITLSPDLSIVSHSIHCSRVKLTERLTYEETDRRIAQKGSEENLLYQAACALRANRVEAGALIFRDPEVVVRVNENGEIDVGMRDRESPSQILVSEMMIQGNHLFARFLRDYHIPGIFRSQPPAAEKIDLGNDYDPVRSYRARKALIRGDIGPDPAPHSTLGLDPYATATSPLRRYPDLLVQRQIKSFLTNGRPLIGRDELEGILTEISYPLERAMILERERQRYFLLKYLEQHRDQEYEAVVLHRFTKFHLVQITDLCLNAALSVSNGQTLTPGERVLARVEKVNARNDRLNLSLVKLL